MQDKYWTWKKIQIDMTRIVVAAVVCFQFAANILCITARSQLSKIYAASMYGWSITDANM